MYAALTGSGWQRNIAGTPCDSYTYYRGGQLQLSEFVERNQGKIIIGMISYDLGYELLNIQQTKPDDLALPDVYFLAFDYINDVNLEETSRPQVELEFTPQLSRTEYNRAFEKLKAYIYEGDVYQANLTHRLESSYDADPRQLFAHLAHHNPATMSAYLEGPDFAILSCSPERFISINDGLIETTPIKGTRPLGQEKELLASEKEEAELNMITDLLRNDLGKVSAIGSVNVTA